jgi:hypothetical protein
MMVILMTMMTMTTPAAKAMTMQVLILMRILMLPQVSLYR